MPTGGSPTYEKNRSKLIRHGLRCLTDTGAYLMDSSLLSLWLASYIFFCLKLFLSGLFSFLKPTSFFRVCRRQTFLEPELLFQKASANHLIPKTKKNNWALQESNPSEEVPQSDDQPLHTGLWGGFLKMKAMIIMSRWPTDDPITTWLVSELK